MSVLSRTMPLCALVLLASLPAFAGQSTVAPASPVLPLTQPATPTDHRSFTRRAEGEIQAWGAKLHRFDEQAKATGEAAGNATGQKLHEAYAGLRRANRGLQTAGRDTWEGARHAYQDASDKLVATWQDAERHL